MELPLLILIFVKIKDSGQETQSDGTGTYELPDIPVGHYVVSFELEGFYTDTRTDIIVRPGRTSRMMPHERTSTQLYLAAPCVRVENTARFLDRQATQAASPAHVPELRS